MYYRQIILAFCLLCQSTIALDKSSSSIVVIGAGLSGFQATANLIENGFSNIVVLEAENRIGGRINSVPYADGKIDLGGQWVHGEEYNILFETAENFYAFGSSNFDGMAQTYVFSNGTQPDQDDSEKLVNIGEKILENYAAMALFDGSLNEFFVREFDKKMAEAQYQSLNPNLVAAVKELMIREITGFHAAKSSLDISAKLNSKTEATGGNQHLTWKKDGFVKYFDFITKKAIDITKFLDVESKIQFNKKVTNIKYNQESTDKVIVECSDGSTFTADHVIFTGSVGVLKKYHKSLFTPNLSQEKVLTIDSTGFGCVGKIFLEFDEPFWPAESSSFVSYAILWDDNDRNEVIATNRQWLFGLAGFYKVDQYPKLIEGFLGGAAVESFENLSDEKLIDDTMWFLEKLMKQSLPKPKVMLRSKWLTNENFLGAYTYTSMSAQKFNVGPRQLAKSIKNIDESPIIVFAGEATDLKYQSYANGAVSSGKRAANEINDYYL